MSQIVKYNKQIEAHPYLLNDITNSYLQEITSESSTIIKWKNIQNILFQLNSSQTSLQQSILIFNLLKNILRQTFQNVNGFKQNKIFCWVGMVYASKCHVIIQEIQKLSQQIEETGVQEVQGIQQEKDLSFQNQEHNKLIKDLLKNICFGLLFSQIMISLVQKANLDNTSNRVFYPELYRFVLISLQSLNTFIAPNLKTLIQNEPTVKTTKIIQQLVEPPKKNLQVQKKKKKKVNNNKQTEKQSKQEQNKQKQASSFVIAKIIQILLRSFKICKKNVVSSINIVKKEIYEIFKKINGNQEKQRIQNENICQDNKISLKKIIQNYLAYFEQKQNIQGNIEMQIEQQNKIIEVKQLTPRFLDQQKANEIKKLRIKKKKLTKKIQADARTAKINRLQQQRVIQDVRNERLAKRQKKELFVMQKQTQEAKKQHNKVKKIKQIQKQGKKRNGDKTKKIKK